MITPTNIPTQYLYAKEAFPYSEMNSAYLKKMDEEEKVIAEKEDADMKARDEEYQIKGKKYGFLGGGVFGLASSIPAVISVGEYHSRESNVLCVIITTALFAGLGGVFGWAEGTKGDKELKQTITLRRIDRLDEKMREIGKKIQIDGKVLEEKEIQELEKAQIFFSNRSLEFKTSKNKSQNTTIISQNNQITMTPQRV